MRGFKNFKGSDARYPSIHFLFCDSMVKLPYLHIAQKRHTIDYHRLSQTITDYHRLPRNNIPRKNLYYHLERHNSFKKIFKKTEILVRLLFTFNGSLQLLLQLLQLC